MEQQEVNNKDDLSIAQSCTTIEPSSGAGGDDGSLVKTECESDEDERKIFVGALNWETTKSQLKEYFEKFGEVTEVILKEDMNGRSRGFGFVTFADSSSRELVLQESKHELLGRNIDPKKVIPKIYKIFVGALDPSLTEQKIREHFSQYGEILEIDLPFNKMKGERRAFAFIRYKTEDALSKALLAPKKKLGDREYEIKKALPNQRGHPNFENPRYGFRPGRGRGAWGWGGHGFPPAYGSYNGYSGYNNYNSGYQNYGNFEQYNSNWGGDYQSHGSGSGGGGGAGWL